MREDIDSAIGRLAEAKILEAIEKGAFDKLPGRGRPLNLEDMSLVPDDLRVGYILLKNSGYLPEELELYKEITSLNRLIECCGEGESDEKNRLRKKLLKKTVRYQMMRDRKAKKIPSF